MDNSRPTREREMVARATALLLADLANPPTMTNIASHMGIAKYELSRLFQKVLQKTGPALLREKRIARAAELLRDTEQMIGEIAVSVGYRSQSAFCRAFESEHGMQPSTYRSTHRRPADAGATISFPPRPRTYHRRSRP